MNESTPQPRTEREAAVSEGAAYLQEKFPSLPADLARTWAETIWLEENSEEYMEELAKEAGATGEPIPFTEADAQLTERMEKARETFRKKLEELVQSAPATRREGR